MDVWLATSKIRFRRRADLYSGNIKGPKQSRNIERDAAGWPGDKECPGNANAEGIDAARFRMPFAVDIFHLFSIAGQVLVKQIKLGLCMPKYCPRSLKRHLPVVINGQSMHANLIIKQIFLAVD